ncbi:hypothetical protein EYR40_000127 [Pleurotus pulmonarius]|nr:hypothetical protein EYR36_001510 [Pleurotus pulmonarius]KAF4607792.1 hypothetical protein EYR40_000127 [Pleurotus pulmonarius]
MTSITRRVWTTQEIRDATFKRFNKRPCLFQIQVAKTIYCARKDVVACAPTGSGKTLSFWMPLVMAQADGLRLTMIVVTPLNLLGKQNMAQLSQVGIRAVAISSENNSPALWKEVKDRHYDVLITNPEILMGNEHVASLLADTKFASSILQVVFDEGHCISEWGKFRKGYTQLGILRNTIRSAENIPFYVASATLPKSVLHEISQVLRLRESSTEYILQSNDRPEVSLLVQPLVYPANSFKDLEFLLKGNPYCDESPGKFIVFFDNIKEAEAARNVLRKRLNNGNQLRVKYFHSTMTQAYREEELEKFRQDEVWGICSTDAFGMGMDLPDIKLVVQWRATCGLNTLFQRFGRAARGKGETGVGILLVDKKDLDDENGQRGSSKRKATNQNGPTPKRRAPTSNVGQQATTESRCEPSNGDLMEVDVADSIDSSHAIAAAIKPQPPVSMDPNECRKRYHKQGGNPGDRSAVGKGRLARGNDLGSPMDDYINAHLRGVCCQRIIPSTFFGNDRRGNDTHLACDPNDSAGCRRCRPPPKGDCCFICTPEAFTQYSVLYVKPKRAPQKSSIKKFTMSTAASTFRTALLEWRKTHALAEMGATIVQLYGAKMFMTNDIVARIVACAALGKLTTLEQLDKETGWDVDWAGQHKTELLNLIHKFFPTKSPPPTLSTTTTQPTASSEVPLPSKPKELHCRRCGGTGHIKTNRKCPLYQQERFTNPVTADKENTASPSTSHASTTVLSTQGTHTMTQPVLRDHITSQR